VIGIAWAVLRPLLITLVFTIVFGRIANMNSSGVPYALFTFTAILPWQFFATAVSDTSMSLVTNTNFLSKVYFPRILIPASTVAVSAADFVVSLFLLAAMMAWHRHVPDWRLVTLPLFFLQAAVFSLGLGVWLSALTVKYRDFRYVVPFIVQFGIYVSPVGFPSEIVPAQWRFLYFLNPMAGIIDGFRWSMLAGATDLYLPGLLLSAVVTLLTCLVGVLYFRDTERYFADIA
jgi:lipopolysaccharide transport system permease protein